MRKKTLSVRKISAASILAAVCSIAALGFENGTIVHAEEIVLIEGDSENMTGSYDVPADWIKDSEESTDEENVYTFADYEDADATSTITCSYMDTNYSVMEYEQLRDMLTNNLIYSNVDAQISTSAVYTLAKDYLYILIVDDSARDYRDIYHYVVGDYRCFLVEVREYREEAELAKAQEQDTPQEVGQKIAEEFTWNTAW